MQFIRRLQASVVLVALVLSLGTGDGILIPKVEAAVSSAAARGALRAATAVKALRSSDSLAVQTQFGPARQNQVLTFKDGKIMWADPSTSLVGDFRSNPGSGRKPASDLSGSNRHYGTGNANASTTTTTTSSGLSTSEADSRYVNIAGDTMNGALVIDYNGLGLNIRGTASGDVLHAERLLTVSGSSVFDGNARFNSTLTINAVTYSFPASDGASSGKVLKTNALGQLSWADDNATGIGLSQASGDNRFVNTAGDTMVGALTIRLSQGSLGLKVLNTASGNILHAEKDLTSSGTLTVVGTTTLKSSVNVSGTISGQTLTIMNGQSSFLGSVGIGTTSPKAKLEVQGTLSGARLFVSTAFSGAGLSSCSGAGQKLLWNSTTQQFACGTDQRPSENPFGTGNTLTIGDARYVNRSGDTMTGALVINLSSGTLGLRILQTASGNILHAEKDLTSSGTLTVVGVSRFKNNLNVVGTVSGAALTVMNGTSYVLGSLGIGTTSPKAKLDVSGTISGTTLVISRNGSFSGSLIVTSSIQTRGSLSGSTISGFALGSCNGSSQKLLYNNSTQKFECSSDLLIPTNSFGTGNALTIGDSRYLKSSGGTLTGRLTIGLTSGTLGLRILQTASGNILHAEKDLTSSGTLTVVGVSRFKNNLNVVGTVSGAALTVMNGTSYVLGSLGIGTTSPKAKLEVLGSFSGSRLYAASAFSGAGLTTCSSVGQKLLWNSTTQQFSCGTDLNTVFGTGNVLTLGDARYLRTSGGTLTGALRIALTTGTMNTVGLNVTSTVSGAVVHAEKTLTSSGGLVFETSFSGSSLFLGTSLHGAGLSNCLDGNKLTWNGTTGTFGCAQDQSGAVLTQGEADTRYLRTAGGTMTGALTLSGSSVALKIIQTASGNILHAEKDLTSSGTLTVSGIARFKNNVNVVGTISGSALTVMNGTSYVLGSLGIGTTSPKAKLEVLGSFSGSRLYAASAFSGAGLTTCSGAGQKLLWNSTTQQFSCGTDQNPATSGFSSGNVLTIGDARYVNTSGDTMTGALVINLSSGTLGLRILNTASGNILHAEKDLTSSGTLTVVGVSRFKNNLNVVGTVSGAALTVMNGTSYVLGSLGIGTTSPKAKLDVSGTISGTTLVISRNGSFSGTLIVVSGITTRGTLSGSNLTVSRGASISGTLLVKTSIVSKGSVSGATIGGFGLTSCNNATNSKLLYNNSLQRFECGSDIYNFVFGTGNVLQIGDARYVKKQGDTMTGALAIALTSGSLGLRIIQTASGNIIHAEKSLTSSGFILVKQRRAQGSGALIVSQRANSTGMYILSSSRISPVLVLESSTGSARAPHIAFGQSGIFDVAMYRVTGATLGLSGHLVPGVTNKFDLGSSAKRWRSLYLSGGTLYLGNSSNQASINFNTSSSRFGIDADTDGTNELSILSTGNVGIGTQAPRAKLDVQGTISGSNLVISRSASISGSLLVKNSIVSRSSVSGATIAGFSLGSCSDPTNSKLLYNNSTQKFECGTDQVAVGGITYSEVAGTFVKKSGDTMTGALTIDLASGFLGLRILQTASGDIIHAEKSLTSSGTVTAVGNISTRGTLSGKTLTVMNGNAYLLGSVGIGKSGTPKAKLDVLGTISGAALVISSNGSFSGSLVVKNSLSGSALFGFGLGSCTGTNQKLLYNNSTGRFSCGTDVTSTNVSSGGVLSIGDTRYVKKQGDTMTGTLKNRGYVFSSGTTLTEMSGWNEGLNIIHSGLMTNSVTRLTNRGDLKNIGTVQAGEANFRRGGTFLPKTDYGAGPNAYFVAIGDLNGDGKQDLVSMSYGGNFITVHFNTGSGLFVTSASYTTGTTPDSISIGDVNNDGKPDIVSANIAADTVSVFINKGNGTFYSKTDYATGGSPASVAIDDFNGDGRNDLAVVNATDNTGSMLLNIGGGTFASAVGFPSGTGPQAVISADFNGDGKRDLATSNNNDNTVSVIFNNGNGTFMTKVNYPKGSNSHAQALVAADFTGDGKADLAAINYNVNTMSVFVNTGTGSFAPKVDYATGTTPNGITAGDINGDGKMDILVANQFGGTISSFLNRGNGTFDAKVDIPTSSNPNTVVVGDLNGDGALDIASTDHINQSMSVLLQIPKTILYASAGTGGAVGIGTATPNSALSVSGAMIINAGGNLLNARADTGITLEIVGTSSGRVLHAQNGIRSSGSLIVDGTISGSTLEGFGLASCNGSSQKLVYSVATGKFSCTTDNIAAAVINTGSIILLGDARYVNKSGDTMTGSLTINLSSGYLGLRILQTASGNIIHAEKSLTSSGTILATGAITTQGGSFSGASFFGAGLGSCNSSTQKLLYNPSTGRFSCTTDTTDDGTGMSYATASNIFVNQSGDTMTGALTINLTSGSLGLKIINTASGNIIHAEKTLTSSGNIIAGTDIVARGTIKSDAVVFTSGTTLAEMSGWNEYLNIVHSGLGTNGVTRLTNQGDLKNIGMIQSGEANFRRGGTFLPKTDYTTGTAPYSVAIGDLNGDGKPDMAVANSSSSSVSIFIGTGAGLFVAKVDYTTGTAPYSVAIGDLNGDGKPDLAIANSSAASVSVLLNKGNGTFAAKTDYTAGGAPTSIQIGDFSGDGRPDLISLNSGANSVSVFLNNGNGIFSSKTDYTTGSNPYSVAVADVNGDGKQDVAVTNSVGNSVSVLINNGNGTFATRVDYAVNGSPYSLAFGDLNADQKVDLAVSHTGTNFISVLLNNGNGTFGTKVDYAAATSYSIAIGDLDGNGSQDLVTANDSSSSISIFLNRGNGTFADKVNYTAGTVPVSVSIGDLNADGKPDLAVANYTSATVSVLLNVSKSILYASAGTGGAVGIGTSTPNSALSVSGAVIINRLGTLANGSAHTNIALEVIGTMSGRMLHAQDVLRSSGSLIVEGNMSGSTIQGAGLSSCSTAFKKLWYNSSTNKFVCTQDSRTNLIGTGNVLTIGDARYVNKSGDTMTGALTINLTSGSLGLKIINTASGNIIHAEKTLTSSGNIIAGTDILARGSIKSDAIVFASGTTVAQSSGFFESMNVVHSGIGTNGVQRITRQGNMINIGSMQAGEIKMNRVASGAFASRSDYFSGTHPYGLAIGDTNNDNKPEIVVANASDNTIYVMTNSNANFGSSQVYTTGGLPEDVALADLNGDGRLDIGVVNTSSGSISVFINMGKGSGVTTYASKVDYSVGGNAFTIGSIVAADFNGDGKVDLASLSVNTTKIYILLNNGDGTFAPAVTTNSTNYAFKMAADDFNGDGKQDLVIACNTGGPKVVVQYGKGDGTFSDPVNFASTYVNSGVATGDFNGDNKPDFAIADKFSSAISVFINSGTGGFLRGVEYNAKQDVEGIAVGDMNGDGVPDIVSSGAGAGGTYVSVHLNNGHGIFSGRTDYAVNTQSSYVALGDLNNDGSLDIAASTFTNSMVSVLLSKPTTILYASSGTGGAVGIGTSTPGSALAVSGSVLINSNGNILNTRADVGLALEVIGTMSGRVLNAQSLLRSSGSLAIEKTSYFGSGVFIKTRHTRAQDNVLTIITDYSTTDNTVFRISASGAVYADGPYNSNGADYAEWFATKDTLTPGEVVCIDPLHNNSVSRCTRSGDPNVMGIVSTNPAFVGNVISGAEGLIPPGYALIGLIGQVPAKPSLENGQIFPGDSVTSATTPGFIRKASAGESTVGVALEAYNGEIPNSKNQIPMINVLISRRNQSLTVETLEQKVLDQIASMNLTDQIAQLVNQASINLNINDRVTEALNAELATFDLASEVNTLVDDHLSRLRSGSGGQAGTLSFGQTLTGSDLTTLANAVAKQLATTATAVSTSGSTITNTSDSGALTLASLSTRLSALESLSATGHTIAVAQTSTGSLHAAALTLSSGATINGSLKLSGALILSSSSSQLGPINLSGSSVTIGSLMSTGALTVLGNVTISGLAEFLGDVHIRGELVLSSRQAGFAVIPASGTAVTVTFPRAMTSVPMVIATPNELVKFGVKNVTATGFTIALRDPAAKEIRFSFVAWGSDKPMTTLGTIPSLNAVNHETQSGAMTSQDQPITESGQSLLIQEIQHLIGSGSVTETGSVSVQNASEPETNSGSSIPSVSAQSASGDLFVPSENSSPEPQLSSGSVLTEE